MGETLIYLLLLGVVAWFWLDSMRSREIATHTCKAVCRRDQYQFLDETVSLQNMGIARDTRGTLRIRRSYRFEYTTSGERRYQGMVVMLGSNLQVMKMETQQDSLAVTRQPPD